MTMLIMTLTIVGPRFGNALYENVTDDPSTSDLKCWTKCAATVALSVPCLIGAVSSNNVAKVLTCVSKSKVRLTPLPPRSSGGNSRVRE